MIGNCFIFVFLQIMAQRKSSSRINTELSRLGDIPFQGNMTDMLNIAFVLWMISSADLNVIQYVTLLQVSALNVYIRYFVLTSLNEYYNG